MTNSCQHNCVEELTADHETILDKLNELEKIIGSSSINKDKIKEFLHFTETFAEPHHEKEETVLFPALEKKGIPNRVGPIGMMLLEHETKRGYVKKLSEGLKEGNEREIKENAQAIISLLREHIDKENYILYPCARDVLSEDELSDLSHQCEKIKKHEVKN